MADTKVIWVHLIWEKKDYFFGSISAIYDELTEEQVGITKSSLLHAGTQLFGEDGLVTEEAHRKIPVLLDFCDNNLVEILID